MAAQSFLLTRPAAASERFAAALRESFGKDARVLIAPLMEPEFLNPALPPGKFDALILTSETGAEAARRLSADTGNLPIHAFCVGDRTAQAATAAGFRTQTAKGDAKALVRLIQSTGCRGRFLHLRGRDSVGDIVQNLDSIDILACEAIVYDQKPRPLTPEAAALLAGTLPVVLPLFSPRSADLIVQTGPVRAPLWVAALSPVVAEHARPLLPARMVIADRPDALALLRALECLCVARSKT
jgi:uroporphyrinogen-III synthase